MAKPPKHYQVTADFSNAQLNQSDFGRIFFNLPQQSFYPKTIAELSKILKTHNQKRIPVTIRNAGHSVNGQTLTGAVQINLSKLNKVRFREKQLEVVAQSGASWHEVLQGINFPTYCLPIFPDNPHQEIHVGGSAAVGGIGMYSARYGGFWNYIKSLKLVTMEGEIIECSPTKNPDLFRYSLGGFGRIGVIAEMTITVVPSAKHVLPIMLLYQNKQFYHEDLARLVELDYIDGLCGFEQMHNTDPLSKLGVHENFILVIFEYWNKADTLEKISKIKSQCNADLTVFLKKPPKQFGDTWDFSLKPEKLSKKDLVYWYPQAKDEDQLDLCHPWSDYVLPRDKFPEFTQKAQEIIYRYKMEKYMLRSSFWHNSIDIALCPVLLTRKLTVSEQDFFPLSLDLKDESYAFGFGINQTVPSDLVPASIEMTREVTDLAYSLGGKRYMYGLHQLTKKQVEQQYGKKVVQQWNQLKKKLDPNKLLNIGVIEHLDQ